MKKITEEQLKEYVTEVGDFEKEHRKYSSFYCWSSLKITQDHIDEFAEEGIDASDFLNVFIQMNGMWDDSWGTEWDSISYTKIEEYQELVPEKIIPAHYITKARKSEFVPKWE